MIHFTLNGKPQQYSGNPDKTLLSHSPVGSSYHFCQRRIVADKQLAEAVQLRLTEKHAWLSLENEETGRG